MQVRGHTVSLLFGSTLPKKEVMSGPQKRTVGHEKGVKYRGQIICYIRAYTVDSSKNDFNLSRFQPGRTTVKASPRRPSWK